MKIMVLEEIKMVYPYSGFKIVIGGPVSRRPVPPSKKSKEEKSKVDEDIEEDILKFDTGANIEISGKEAENYIEVLESLGYSTNIDKFTVDSRGDSPELKEKLGYDYLDSRVIIVSERQLEKPCLLQNNSIYTDKVISRIPIDLVKKITPYEALVGNIDLLYGSKSIVGLFDSGFKDTNYNRESLYLRIVLDTLNGSVKKINDLNTKIGFIKESGLKDLDKDFLDQILTEIHPLTTKYESIEQIRDLNTIVGIPIKEELLHFKHKDYDIFLFNIEKEPFLVYSGKKIEAKQEFKILHVSEKQEITDTLFKNGFLKMKENLFDTLEDVARSVLDDQVKSDSGLEGFQFYQKFKQVKDDPEIIAKLEEANWYLLRDLCYGKVEFDSIPLEFKEMTTVPRDETVKKYLKLLNEKS